MDTEKSSATRRGVHPETLAGDGFAYAGVLLQQGEELTEHPHACIEGWVYLGYEGEDENGEHVEVIERVRCRGCSR